jgi:hypothetical protein
MSIYDDWGNILRDKKNISIVKNNYKYKATSHEYSPFLKNIITIKMNNNSPVPFYACEYSHNIMIFLKLRMTIHT